LEPNLLHEFPDALSARSINSLHAAWFSAEAGGRPCPGFKRACARMIVKPMIRQHNKTNKTIRMIIPILLFRPGLSWGAIGFVI